MWARTMKVNETEAYEEQIKLPRQTGTGRGEVLLQNDESQSRSTSPCTPSRHSVYQYAGQEKGSSRNALTVGVSSLYIGVTVMNID